MIEGRDKSRSDHSSQTQKLSDLIEHVWSKAALKTVEALVLIADDVPDYNGDLFRLTRRTIEDMVPVPVICDELGHLGVSRLAHRGRGYCNCVGYASLELRGDKLYASLKILSCVKGKFQPLVDSYGGEIEKRGDYEITIDPKIRSISLCPGKQNSDDRIPEIEL